MSERRLRFKIGRGNFEVELEGDFEYVQGKFEELLKSQPSISTISQQAGSEQSVDSVIPGEELAGILETTPEGKLHFTIQFDRISRKKPSG